MVLYQGFLIASGCNQYESNKIESSDHWGLVNIGRYCGKVWTQNAMALLVLEAVVWHAVNSYKAVWGWKTILHGELELNIDNTTALKPPFENISHSISVRITFATKQNQEELLSACKRGCQTWLELFVETIALSDAQRAGNDKRSRFSPARSMNLTSCIHDTALTNW